MAKHQAKLLGFVLVVLVSWRPMVMAKPLLLSSMCGDLVDAKSGFRKVRHSCGYKAVFSACNQRLFRQQPKRRIHQNNLHRIVSQARRKAPPSAKTAIIVTRSSHDEHSPFLVHAASSETAKSGPTSRRHDATSAKDDRVAIRTAKARPAADAADAATISRAYFRSSASHCRTLDFTTNHSRVARASCGIDPVKCKSSVKTNNAIRQQ
jgi:hypothetical protein